MPKVAILGGGIAGLAAAYYLERERRKATPVTWMLFEAGAHLGGVIKTEQVDGFNIEQGPDSFLTAKTSASELAHELGIAGDLQPSLEAETRTWVLVDGKLVPMPEGMMMMVPSKIWPVLTTPLFSPQTKLRMAMEYMLPPEPLADDVDESVASFVERHFGKEMLDRVAAPLLAGIFGGDASTLSARAVLPQMLAMEKKHSSLAYAAIHHRKENKGKKDAALFTTFRGGMQQLTDALIANLDATAIEVNAPVHEVHRYYDQWRVVTADGRYEMFHHVICALPGHVAGHVLKFAEPELQNELIAIPYSSCMTVALAYEKSKLPMLPGGYGFLVPRSEGKRMMACTIVGQKFANRVPDDGVLLRVFFSGMVETSEADAEAMARKELQEILGITTTPKFVRIHRWAHAMPQYTVGHPDRLKRIRNLMAQHDGLHVVGAAYEGVGIPDCIRGAKETALRVLSD
jgi:oxygen-dependent protoporphyrinogen oxidase